MDSLTKPKLGSTEETNRLLGGDYFDTSTGKQVSQFSPITSKTLSSTPDVKLPVTQPTSSVADGVIASTNQMSEDWKVEEAAIKAVDERNAGVRAVSEQKDGVLTAIGKKYGLISDAQNQRAEAEKQVDPFRTELANINKEIADQNVALRGETDAIMARGDVSKEGQQSLLQNVKDNYGRKLADLAIRQSAANQNVTALETALDRKLELATASIKNDIEYYKEFELANLDNLSKEERQRVQDIVAEKNMQLEAVTKKETAIANVLKEALTNGVKIPDNVVGQLQKAKTDLEAYQILAKNGISLAKAGTGADTEQLYAGLSTPTATSVRAKVGKFSSEPIVTGFSTIQEGRNFAKSLSDTTTNPADDQGLIYALAKALDPNSVVREGEYATAQKYSQSWIKAYGKGVEQALLGTGFLSEEARKNIKKTIESKYLASKTSYDNLYNNTATSINNLTGRADGNMFLTDYAVPEVGKEIKVGGNTYMVGQPYQDASGATWVVDAQGNWKKQ